MNKINIPLEYGKYAFIFIVIIFLGYSGNVKARNMRVSIGGTNYIAEIVDNNDINNFHAWVDTGSTLSNVNQVHDPMLLAKLYAGTRAFLFIERMLAMETISKLLSSNLDYANTVLRELSRVSRLEEIAEYSAKISGKVLGTIYSSQFLLAPANPAISPLSPVAVADLSGITKDTLMLVADISLPEIIDLILASEVKVASGWIENALKTAKTLPISDPESFVVDIDKYSQVANNIANGVDYFTDISLRLAEDDRLNATIVEDSKNYAQNFLKGFVSVFVPDVSKNLVVTSGWARELLDAKDHISTAIDVMNIIQTFINKKLAVHNKGFFGTSPSAVLEYYEAFVARQKGKKIIDTVTIDKPDLISVVTGTSANDFSDARLYVTRSVLLEGYRGVQGVLVVLSEALPFDVTFRYSIYSFSTSDPSEAIENSDFQPQTNQLYTIPAGQLFGVVPVIVHDDSIEEQLVEKFRIAIFDVNGATLPHGSYNDVFMGVIVDDDYTVDSTPIDLNNPTNSIINGQPLLPSTTIGCNLTALSVGTGIPGSTSGNKIDIEYTVANAGDTACRGGLLRLMIADSLTDSSPSLSPDVLELPALAPGERRTWNKKVRLPLTGNGRKYLGIEVSPLLGDADDSLDNKVFIPFSIGPGLSGLPNLSVYVESVYVDSIKEPVVLWGSYVNLRFRISANSHGAPPYHYRIILSKDEYISTEDIILFTGSSRGLGYNGRHYYNKQLLIPDGTAKGLWYLIVQADHNNTILEKYESDNAYARRIIIQNSFNDNSNGFPNLYADSFYIGNRFLTNGGRLEYTVFTVPTSLSAPLFDNSIAYIAHDVCLVLSRDIVLDNEDITFFRHPDILEQPIGGISRNSVNLPVPTWLSDPDFGTGKYYIFAKIDCGDSIVEMDEIDNIAGPIEINYTANISKSVMAVDDTINIFSGNTLTSNLLSNDTTVLPQSLGIEFFGNQRLVLSNGMATVVDKNTGLTLLVKDDGTVTIDASNVPGDLNGSSVRLVKIPYIMIGETDFDKSLGYLKVFIKNNSDKDNDGMPDLVDNCPSIPNENQLDTNGDDIGDACQCGDMNGDGVITNSDAILIKRYLLNLSSPFNAALCDVNGDGLCTNTDAVMIQRSVLGLPPEVDQSCITTYQ